LWHCLDAEEDREDREKYDDDDKYVGSAEHLLNLLVEPFRD
jgi:hypothetical protein